MTDVEEYFNRKLRVKVDVTDEVVPFGTEGVTENSYPHSRCLEVDFAELGIWNMALNTLTFVKDN